jgi:hypothetical protein
VAQYIYAGTITYSNTSNRNTALSAIETELANWPTITGIATAYPAGVNTSGSTVLTISLLVPDEATVDGFRNAMVSKWSAGVRSASVLAISKLGGA